MKPLLSFFLIILLLSLSLQKNAQTSHPFIPPLTHTPQMSLSSLGMPRPPVHIILPEIEAISGKSCKRCPMLQAHIRAESENGKKLRLQMQEQIQAILVQLPPDFTEQSFKNRNQNSQRIGEVWVWKQLSQQD